MKERVKYCHQSKKDFSTMYSAQYNDQKDWVFVCKECLFVIKKDNPTYRYGGTWKK
jgi:hypothetical protein